MAINFGIVTNMTGQFINNQLCNFHIHSYVCPDSVSAAAGGFINARPPPSDSVNQNLYRLNA